MRWKITNFTLPKRSWSLVTVVPGPVSIRTIVTDHRLGSASRSPGVSCRGAEDDPAFSGTNRDRMNEQNDRTRETRDADALGCRLRE